MYQFLFTGDSVIVSFVVGLLTLIGGYILYYTAKKRIKPYVPLSIFIIVFGYGLSGWGLVGIPDMIKANRSSITEQYDVSKDGNIIQFERKTNNRTLEKKVAVKVIGESKDAYQAEYHGDYYQISKLMLRKEITNMYKFLLTDVSYAVLTVVAFIVLIMGVGAWILSVKDADEAIFGTKLPAIATSVVFVAFLVSGYGFTQELTAKQVQPKDAYTITKTGKLITFDEKADNWKLKNKVTAKIVSETKDQYQVEVDGSFYNIAKSDIE